MGTRTTMQPSCLRRPSDDRRTMTMGTEGPSGLRCVLRAGRCDMMDRPFRLNAHRFCLEPRAVQPLYALTLKDREEAFRQIVLGDKEGWICAQCGVSMRELRQLAGMVGSVAGMSSLVIHCLSRPGAVGHVARSNPGELMYSSMFGPGNAELRRTVGSGMLEAVMQRDWLVPVLTPHGEASRVIYLFA